MNKRIIVIVVVILLAIGGGVAYLLSNSSEDEKITNPQSNQTESLETTELAPTSTQGRYVDYSSEIIAQTSGTKILFFHAPWCPQCRDLDSDIKKQGVPEGVTIIKVDYDSNQTLRQTYGVTIQTTLVSVDDDGKLIKKYVAYDEPTLAAVKENLF